LKDAVAQNQSMEESGRRMQRDQRYERPCTEFVKPLEDVGDRSVGR
jgi:hypothetical protein